MNSCPPHDSYFSDLGEDHASIERKWRCLDTLTLMKFCIFDAWRPLNWVTVTLLASANSRILKNTLSISQQQGQTKVTGIRGRYVEGIKSRSHSVPLATASLWLKCGNKSQGATHDWAGDIGDLHEVGNVWAEQHDVHCQGRGERGRKNIWRNNGCKLPKFDEKH